MLEWYTDNVLRKNKYYKYRVYNIMMVFRCFSFDLILPKRAHIALVF